MRVSPGCAAPPSTRPLSPPPSQACPSRGRSVSSAHRRQRVCEIKYKQLQSQDTLDRGGASLLAFHLGAAGDATCSTLRPPLSMRLLPSRTQRTASAGPVWQALSLLLMRCAWQQNACENRTSHNVYASRRGRGYPLFGAGSSAGAGRTALFFPPSLCCGTSATSSPPSCFGFPDFEKTFSTASSGTSLWVLFCPSALPEDDGRRLTLLAAWAGCFASGAPSLEARL